MPDLAQHDPGPAVPERVTLVYAPGKAGTATVLKTLGAALPGEWVGDVRRLTPDGLDEYHRWAREPSARRTLRTHDPRVGRMLRANPGMRVRLVTLVRDPVSMAVSSFFWNFELRHPPQRLGELAHDELVAELVAGGFASRPDYFTGWLDAELRPVTGIDVYARPFPVEAGFAAFRRDRFSLVAIRLEDLDRVYADAFAQIGVAVPQLAAAEHRGDGEPYGEAYAAFKRRAGLPAEWVDAQLSTRYAQHFYSDAERAAIRARWTAEEAGPAQPRGDEPADGRPSVNARSM